MLHTSLSKALHTTKAHLGRLQSLGLRTVEDLLMYFPRAYTDATEVTAAADASFGELQTFEGTLSNYFSRKSKTGKHLTRALFTDDTGTIEVIWFNQPHIVRMYPAGSYVLLTGKPKRVGRRVSLASPIVEKKTLDPIHSTRIVPVYHLTQGINGKWLREKIKPVLDRYIADLEDYLPEELLKELNLMDLPQAVAQVHFPTDFSKLEEAKRRIGFDELFLLQLKVLQKQYFWRQLKEGEGKQISDPDPLLRVFLDQLPFTLTGAQQSVLEEIVEDFKKSFPMSRLVQGDVGSGKTVVAAAAAYLMVKNGFQVAFMAPTEILAKQHFKTAMKFLSGFGMNIQMLLGGTPVRQKKQIVQGLQTGMIDIIIGTHALIQESVRFRKLGLAVIDEQHRFGVRQRDILKQQGSPHLLSLSATPIPRTLAMTIYGDQDLSIIDELPPGRQPIQTRIVPEKKRNDAYKWIREQVGKGRQVFVICPLIDESDEIETKAVKVEYERLRCDVFPDLKVGFLHGKLKQQEKDEIMLHFAENKINILVSTSVVEVGIDVPNATIMVIEGAQRFGLSQLHQFRGRVGRGGHQSYCFLFTDKESPEATKRLVSMVQHSSGFKLAEIDMKLRGAGEIYGVKQSGIPDLKMASFGDSKAIMTAREYAQRMVNKDPTLKRWPKLLEKIAQKEEVFVGD